MCLHQCPIVLWVRSASAFLELLLWHDMIFVFYTLAMMQLSVLPNILILNRDCRKSKLAVKFSTLYCIYSFIMIILYHSFTDCCAVKISVGSQSDLSCNLNHHHTLHLYCFQSIKHFQVLYLILFDSQNNTAGKEGQYTCAVQKKTDTDRKFHRAPLFEHYLPLFMGR